MIGLTRRIGATAGFQGGETNWGLPVALEAVDESTYRFAAWQVQEAVQEMVRKGRRRLSLSECSRKIRVQIGTATLPWIAGATILQMTGTMRRTASTLPGRVAVPSPIGRAISVGRISNSGHRVQHRVMGHKGLLGAVAIIVGVDVAMETAVRAAEGMEGVKVITEGIEEADDAALSLRTAIVLAFLVRQLFQTSTSCDARK